MMKSTVTSLRLYSIENLSSASFLGGYCLIGFLFPLMAGILNSAIGSGREGLTAMNSSE